MTGLNTFSRTGLGAICLQDSQAFRMRAIAGGACGIDVFVPTKGASLQTTLVRQLLTRLQSLNTRVIRAWGPVKLVLG